MNSKLIPAAVLVATALGFPAAALADHSWSSYHWARTANPFVLQVVDSTTPDWDGELLDSLQAWSSSEVLDLVVVATDDLSKTRRRCPAVIGQLRVCNMAYGNNGWLGLATIGIDSSGHIDQGTAKMNDSYSSYWSIPGEKNHVMCQEIGHLFGLGHTSEDGSSQGTCMDYSNDINSQWPNAHDYEQLALIYAHADGYNSYDNGGSGGGGGGCTAPAGKGCNKREAGDVPPMGTRVRKGKSDEMWVAPRPDGGLWVHHVRLAPE